MAICNTFKNLSKETGTFLTFGQYVEDLTAWKVLSNYYNVVPSKFIAIDCQTKQYDNWSFPRALQELFENGCACFKNDNEFKWEPKYAKNLFWKTLFEMGVLQVEKSEDEDDKTNYIKGVKYVGDINIQSYDEVEGMGYSEIYCHIPNEAPAYKYSFNTNKSNINKTITRNYNDLIEGFRENELNGAEKLSILPEKYIYQLSSDYTFSWDDKLMNTIQLADSNFKINLVVVLYDVLDSHNILHKDIPMGIYITGLFKNGTIQNQITKYVSNEDIYNSGTSYGLRICTRFVASGIEDNYIIKEVTCEDNNQADLSRVLSQLSISQNKMDEILSNKYVVDQNYKNLLAIFKNSKTNTPYIKRVNDNDYWFVNGKIVGPSAAENLFEPYSNDDIKSLLESNTTQLLQIFPNIIEITDNIDDPKIIKKDEYDGEYVLDFSYVKWNEKETDVLPYQIKLSWDVRYNDESINPTRFTINDSEYTNTNHIIRGMTVEAFKNGKGSKEWVFDFNAEYEFWNTNKKVIIRAVKPSYFGCLSLSGSGKIDEQLEQAVTETENGTGVLQKIVKYNGNITGKLSTDSTGTGTVCVIYPEYYGNLKSIYDLYGNIYSINNSTEIVEGDLKDFNLHKIRCKFHNEPTTYNAYISKEGVYINGYTLNFEVTDPRPKLN